MKSDFLVRTISTLLAMLLPAALLQAQSYSVTEIGTFEGDGSSAASDINDVGQIVGSIDVQDSPHAFLWWNGAVVEFGNESQQYTLVYGSKINSLGQVAGTRYIGGTSSAFFWQAGTTVDLGRLARDASITAASSINDAGFVTGINAGRPFTWQGQGIIDFSLLPNAEDFRSIAAINNWGAVTGTIVRDDAVTFVHAAIWQNGQTLDLGDLPGGTTTGIGNYSVPTAINDDHQVVGYSDGDNGYHAFLWSNGVMSDLGALPGLYNWSEATDINNRGTVVGYSGNEISHAFVWDSVNGMRDLNTLLDETGTRWTLTRAYGINNHGQIVGTGIHDGLTRGFLLTPVPEPSTLMTAGVALAGAMLVAAKRRRFRQRKLSTVVKARGSAQR
jgi:probable HAF family extracellular repeat protein